MLHLARNSTAAQLVSIVQNYNRYIEIQQAEDAGRRYAHRGLTTTYDEDGFLVIKARLLPEDGALVLQALQLAESWTEPSASAEASPMEASPSRLRTRDPSCRWPGCHRRAMLDPHHIRWVTHGGETHLENLVHLCKRHHWCVHEDGFGVRVRDGKIEFLRRDGAIIEPDPRPLRGHSELLLMTNEGKGIDRQTAESEWGGEQCDPVYIAELIIEDNIRHGHLQPL